MKSVPPTPRTRSRVTVPLAALALAIPATLGGLALASGPGAEPDARVASSRAVDDAEKEAFETITEEEIEATVELLTNPYLEGRDSPSDGLDYAARWVATRFETAGLESIDEESGHIDTYQRRMPAPDPKRTTLETPLERELELGVDFTAMLDAEGACEGPGVFCGYGISVRGYDGLEDLELQGAIAIFVVGEVRHKRALGGPEITQAANVYRKLDRVHEMGAVGALVIRREVADDVARPPEWTDAQPMGFRRTWAYWADRTVPYYGPSKIPALEISWSLAEELLDDDLDARMAKIDRKGKPVPWEGPRPQLAFENRLGNYEQPLPNVVGILPGSDPELADEYIVIGAHLDHIGADPLGRIGVGADDNASGTAALIEVMDALAADPPPRSIIAVAFSSEEDGLLGSEAFVRRPPVERDKIVAMVNLDMIGRGPDSDVVALGVRENPDFEDILWDARRRHRTGVRTIETELGQELFQRSDHYSFHKVGIPAVFFFEHVPLADNPDYHTWRDLPELLDYDKIVNTARLTYSVVRELAELEERLPSPGGR